MLGYGSESNIAFDLKTEFERAILVVDVGCMNAQGRVGNVFQNE